MKKHEMMKTKRGQGGFTLIELLIVVAIIGILAAVALPRYQDYVTRTKVSEGLNLAASAKTAIAVYHSEKGGFPTAAASAGYETATGNDVRSVVVSAAGASAGDITITYRDIVSGGGDEVLVLRPNASGGSIIWNCFVSASGGITPAGLPETCRN